MHIGIHIKEFPPDVIGGTETQTLELARQIQTGTQHQVTVYTKAYPGEEPHDPPFELVRVPNWRITPFISTLTFVFISFLYVLRDRRKLDLLQCMMIYPNGFIGYIVNRFCGLPYFAWIRGGDYYLMNDIRWKRWMMRCVLADTLVLAQSPEIREDVREDFDDIECEIEVLGNAVSIPNEASLVSAKDTNDNEKMNVLYVGRLAPKKGVEYLIEAMADIDAALTIVGDGSERNRLEQYADDTESDVTFVGEVDPNAVDEYYRSAEIFVLPSIEGEGLPNVVLEAMAWGLSVIATDSGGLPTVIEDGTTGYVVPMRDPDALRNRIERLVADRESAAEMGTAAHRYVRENHSWDWLIDELEILYHSVAKRDSNRN